MTNKNYQTEILIVGAGLAGIVTALELIEAGHKVLLVDRDTPENIGGLAKWAFGGMFFVQTKEQKRTGIRDSIDLALKDWYSYASFAQEEYWGKKWADQYVHLCTPHGYRWLKGKGFSFFPIVNWTERGLLEPGNSVPRFHMIWGTGWGLIESLVKQLQNHALSKNLSFVFNARIQNLTVDNARVSGATGVLETENRAFTVSAERVVVATGGINGSIERVKKNWYKPWGDPPEVILNGAHPFAIGDLHDATQKVNGHVVNLDLQWNYAAGIRHYAPRKPDHGLSLVPCKSALWLNYEGQRMGPMPLVTAYDTRYIVERICQEKEKYSWQVLNYKIAKKEFAISGSEHNEFVRDKKFLSFVWQTLVTGNRKLVNKIIDQCEDVVIAQSVDELVDKMNDLTGEGKVHKDFVKTAIKDYDAQIDRGSKFFNDEQLRRIAHARRYRGDRTRTCAFQKIDDPKARPLIAIREFILSRKSLGGIQTNLQSQVLSRPDSLGNQEAIPGLYAVGEAAGFGGGGMHGQRSLEGTFLGGCVISARVAAADISNKKLEA
ncbi:MAG: FAD-binding dehydrogenase [Saprospiraceae bacterium]|nr:FAD-binding dehydrogenase [Saprospiraceae bacterium]